MDHFNVTLQKDGALVATRRGLQVSKQKYHGISFVHTSGPQGGATTSQVRPSSASGANDAAPPVDLAKPLQQRFKFVTKETRKPSTASKSGVVSSNKARRTAEEGVESTAAEKDQGKAMGQEVGKQKAGRSHTNKPPRGSKVPKDPSSGTLTALPRTRGYSLGTIQTSPAPAMPVWGTHNLASQLSKADQVMFHNYFPIVPRKMYPFEEILTYNPARSQQFYDLVINDMAALHCVLMCGSMFEAVLKKDPLSEDLAYHVSRACSVINKKLDKEPREIASITLECITTLALMASYVGRYDHWHVHMRGLQKMIELNGGVEGMRPALLAKIRKTDLKGAATLASTPYLPFHRYYPNISDAIPEAERLATSSALRSLLGPCGVSPVVEASVCDFARFVRAVSLASTCRPARSVTFDPNGFTEEWHRVQYQLICRPGPLRDESAGGGRQGDPPIDVSKLKTESYVSNHLVAFKTPVIPAKHDNVLDPALRICALLYLKELIPDFPRNLGGYAILLALLHEHMQELAKAWPRGSRRQTGPASNRSRVDQEHTAAGAGGVAAAAAAAPAAKEEAARVAERSMRPVVLWICLVGNLVCQIADVNESRFGSDLYDRSVYRSVARIAVCSSRPREGEEGGREEGDELGDADGVDAAVVDALEEHDFALCRLLDIKTVRGQSWDDRDALKRLLRGE